MKIVVLNETSSGETRVALVPESIRKLVALKAEVAIESGAGAHAFVSDADYQEAGASVSSDRQQLLESAEVLVAINRPRALDLAALKKGAVVIGFLRPLDEPAALEPVVSRGLNAFAMELMPRITRAQSMDALSSMATVAGYKAVLVAASHLPDDGRVSETTRLSPDASVVRILPRLRKHAGPAASIPQTPTSKVGAAAPASAGLRLPRARRASAFLGCYFS